MATLLHLDSSPMGGHSVSRHMSKIFVEHWKKANADGKVITRDLTTTPVVPVTAAWVGAAYTPPDARTAEQKETLALSETLVGELLEADEYVFGVPMYNFGVPSQLKAYFDHIARAGETFRYTASGPVGLLTGKKVYVFAARGGLYAGTALDTQTSYVRDFLRFVGIDDIEFVYAEGLAISAESKASGLASAAKQIERLAA